LKYNNINLIGDRGIILEKLIMIGPIPPPLNGQSVAFNALVEYLNENNDWADTVDLTSKSQGSKMKRLKEYFRIFKEFNGKLTDDVNIVYLTTAQSRHGFFRDFFFIEISKLKKKKVITHLHGGNFKSFYENENYIMRYLIKRVYKKVDKNIVLGKALINMFDFGSNISNKTIAISNGMNVNISSIDSSEEKVDFEVLYLSNLIETKGYFKLLKAVPEILKKYPNVKFNFAGEFLHKTEDSIEFSSEEEAELKFNNFIKEKNLSDRIIYHGVVSGKEKEELLKDADIFILPTTYSNEGQPISIIEAMAYGCAIISTNYRAIPDLVENNINGLLIDTMDIENGIKQSLLNLLGNQNLLESMSKKSVEIYKSKFTLIKHAENIKMLINSLKSN